MESDRIYSWIKNHKKSIIFLFFLLGFGGGIFSFKLPVSLFPKVDFPRVVVNIETSDMSAEMMDIKITRPVVEAIRNVPGVLNVRATSSRGSSEISINFEWGSDMVASMLQVEAAVNRLIPNLPTGTVFRVRRMDPTVFPVIAYSMTSENIPTYELFDIAKYQIAPLFLGVKGVAKVDVVSSSKEEYQIFLNVDKMQAYGLTMEYVVKKISENNIISAIGKTEDKYRLYLVLTTMKISSIDDIQNIIIKNDISGVVYLKDIASIKVGTIPEWIKISSNGKDAVLINIYQQPTGNTVEISKQIKEKIETFKKHLPEDIKLTPWYDQSELIIESAGSVRDSILIGIFLGIVVVFIFLRNIKITFISILVVPTIILTTILFLYSLKFSFNIMTLSGLAAAIGLIIDDVIIMTEHIIRRLSEKREEELSPLKASFELAKPFFGSSFVTIVVFLPLAFVSGITGEFFRVLSISMAISLVISYLTAIFVVPIIAEAVFRGDIKFNYKENTFIRLIVKIYSIIMNSILKVPYLVFIIIIIIVFLGFISYKNVGSGFMPKMDEGGFVIDCLTEPGTSLSETDRLMRQIEKILVSTPEVESYSRRTGARLSGGLTEANSSDFFVKLKPPPRRNIEDIMDEIRQKIHKDVPGVEIEMAQLMEDLIGDLTAVPQPIEIKLYSEDFSKLLNLAPKVAEKIKNIKGVVDIRNGIVLAGDAMDIEIDPLKASFEGVTPEFVSLILRGYISGTVATQIQKGNKMINLRVIIPNFKNFTKSDLENLLIQAPDGHLFPLKRVAKIRIISGQPQIKSENLKPMIAVTARISGRDMGSVASDVKKIIHSVIPRDIYYELGGLYKEQQTAFKELIAVFLGAILLVFFLLLLLFENFKIALSILFLPLLSISAVFFGLWVTHTELNISSMMGITMIVGILTKAAIFYFFEYMNIYMQTNDIKRSIVEAGRHRLRPLTMTTMVAILALLPVAFGLGQGTDMIKPLAIAIIFGLLVQIPISIIIMPTIYYIFLRLNESIKYIHNFGGPKR